MLILVLLLGAVFALPGDELRDGETSRKILGSSVVTSVSVIMDTGNGSKAVFTDAVGKPVPKPSNPSDLASPINLLNPDRYEFYTFDDSGDLVKRLMTLDEIQGIVATGDSEGFIFDSFASPEYTPEKRVNDVVNNVQNVLKEEMQTHKDSPINPILDTPDVSDSWSMILPAIFGNSGEDIKPEKPITHVTPDTIMIEPTVNTYQLSSFPEPDHIHSIQESFAQTSPRSTTARSTTKRKPTPSMSTAFRPSSTVSTTTNFETKKNQTMLNVEIYSNSKSTTEAGSKTSGLQLDESNSRPIYRPSTYRPAFTSRKPTKRPTSTIKISTPVKYSTSGFSISSSKLVTKPPSTTASLPSSPSSAHTVQSYIPTLAQILNITRSTHKVTQVTPPSIGLTTFTVVSSSKNTEKPSSTEVYKPSTSNKEVDNDLSTLATEHYVQLSSSSGSTEKTRITIPSSSFSPSTSYETDTEKVTLSEALDKLLLTSTNIYEINTELGDNTSNEEKLESTTNAVTETVPTETTEDPITTQHNLINSIEQLLSQAVGNIVMSTGEKVDNIGKVEDLLKKNNTMNQLQQEAGTVASNMIALEDTTIVPTTISQEDSMLSDSVGELLSQIYGPQPILTTISGNGDLIKGTSIRKEDAVVNVSSSTESMVTEKSEESTTLDRTIETEFTTVKVPHIINITIISLDNKAKPAKADTSLEESFDELFVSTTEGNIKLNDAEEDKTTTESEISTTESEASTTEAATDKITTFNNYFEDRTLTTKDESVETTTLFTTSTYVDVTTREIETTTSENDIRAESTTEVTTEAISTLAANPEPLVEVTINEKQPLTEQIESGLVSSNTASISSVPTSSIIPETSTVSENWVTVSTVSPNSAVSQNVFNKTEHPISTIIEPPTPVDLVPKPLQGFGLEDSTSNLDTDIYQFAQLCNELAFGFWKSVTSGVSSARSVVVSPFAATSLLAMVFLGARGATSGEMNEILKLDDVVTFNPHLIFKNVTESIQVNSDAGVASSVIIRELFSDRSKGKLLNFYKERARQFYDGHVEEVGFKEIGDIIRRRTNLLVKKYTDGKIAEFLKDGSIKVKPPLAGVSVNIFQTDCSQASTAGRDGELHFVVLPSIRQRRLIPIPAIVYRNGFLAGYEPSLDATAVSLGTKDQVVSTIFVIPGQQGIAAPGDGLARLEKRLVESSFKKGAWSRLLRSLIPRPGLEIQIPRFSHKSIVNATNALKRMGLKDLFDFDKADLRGLNGVAHELHLADMLQLNNFATCGEERIDETHHAEIYPAIGARSARRLDHFEGDFYRIEMEEPRDYQRAFHDPSHDPSYLALPLPLRPRQARVPEPPRLRFDRPFLYFVRHNPTGLILHMGRFNPRLLP